MLQTDRSQQPAAKASRTRNSPFDSGRDQMIPLASGQTHGIERSSATLARRIHETLSPLGFLPGVSVSIRTIDGLVLTVVKNGEFFSVEAGISECLPSDVSVFSFSLEEGFQILVRNENRELLASKLVGALLQSSLKALETERREELFLEELGTNWESLEALYEISTEALRFGNINDALKRLMDRLTVLQDGLHAALFIRRDGLYYPLIGAGQDLSGLAPSQLGPVEEAVEELRLIVVNQLTQPPDERACWRRASGLAAAPFAWEGSLGFVVVWNEEGNCDLDSSVLRMLEAMTYQASVMMQSDRLNRKVRENELLAQEIEIASSIQQTLLLANAPTNVPALEIAACSIPSQRIDGDFHDFFQHPDGTIDVLLGDVMGKGVAAALLGAATKSQFLRATANLALRSTREAPRPASIVNRAASRLSDRLIAVERFVTLCYARFDSKSRRLAFVDCGHTGIIRESKSQPDCSFLRGTDLPLGVLPDYRCEEHSVDFRRGETYLLYSDGVTECRSPAGEFFGAERLAECVQNWSSLGPALLVEQIRKEATRFTQSESFSDDFTCIAMRVKLQKNGAEPLADRSAVFECSLRSLAAFRGWLWECSKLLGSGLAEQDIARMQLACSEVFANCVIHASDVQPSAALTVRAEIFEDHVIVRMIHAEPAFDPLAAPAPAFDGSRDSGFGIYMVLRSSDEASFARQPDGTNITTLTFLRGTMEQIT